jgi:serine/threonine protein kinase
MRERFQIETGGNPGGMGVVYRARDKVLNRVVALKHIECTDISLIDALVSEARIVAGLESRYIVNVLDLVVDGHSVWIVSEWIQGQHFADLRGPCGNLFLAATALQCVQGLAAIHERKIIHRDVKPENMMLSEQGTIRFIDFGVAFEQQAKSGRTIVGTLKYMHPSILQGGRATPDTDRYALGLILVELFSGQPMWPEQSMLQMCRRSVADIRNDVRKRCQGMLPPLSRLIDQLILGPADFEYSRIIESLESLVDGLATIEGVAQTVSAKNALSCDEHVLRTAMLSKVLLDSKSSIHADLLRKNKVDLGYLQPKASEWRYFQNQQTDHRPKKLSRYSAMSAMTAMTIAVSSVAVVVANVNFDSEEKNSVEQIIAAETKPAVAETKDDPIAVVASQIIEPSKNKPATSEPSQPSDKPSIVKLRVTSNTWADVKIDGKPVGRIPSIQPIAVSSGKHKFEFSGTMIEPLTKTFDIPRRSSHVLDVQLQRRLGTVTVESERPTKVRVAGRSYDVQGSAEIRVPFGQHELEILENGIVKDRKSVAIVPNADAPRLRLN